jgi:hypothetical protein
MATPVRITAVRLSAIVCRTLSRTICFVTFIEASVRTKKRVMFFIFVPMCGTIPAAAGTSTIGGTMTDSSTIKATTGFSKESFSFFKVGNGTLSCGMRFETTLAWPRAILPLVARRR